MNIQSSTASMSGVCTFGTRTWFVGGAHCTLLLFIKALYKWCRNGGVCGSGFCAVERCLYKDFLGSLWSEWWTRMGTCIEMPDRGIRGEEAFEGKKEAVSKVLLRPRTRCVCDMCPGDFWHASVASDNVFRPEGPGLLPGNSLQDLNYLEPFIYYFPHFRPAVWKRKRVWRMQQCQMMFG